MGARFLGIIILFAGLALSTFAQASQYRTITTPPTFESSIPGSFTPCATDFHTCNVTTTGLVTVFYGAQGKYVVAQGQGSFTCLPGTFGINDPIQNVQKTCWVFAGYAGTPAGNLAGSPDATVVTSVPAGLKACAVDFNACKVSGMWTGVYGANGIFRNIAGTGDFTCLPSTFGINDPVQNVQKTCYVAPVTLGSFTLTESSPTLSALVPGIKYGYQLISGDGTKVWDISWNVSPGQSISNLPSSASYYLAVSINSCPAGYSLNFGRPGACPEAVQLPWTGAAIQVTAQKPAVAATISYQVQNQVIQIPTLTIN